MYINTDDITTDKELQALVSALQGLQGQVQYNGNVDMPKFNGEHVDRYIFKPKPKLRPWTAEEGVGRVVKWPASSPLYLIVGSTRSGDFLLTQEKDGVVTRSPSCLLRTAKQLGGSPCGTMEEV